MISILEAISKTIFLKLTVIRLTSASKEVHFPFLELNSTDSL